MKKGGLDLESIHQVQSPQFKLGPQFKSEFKIYTLLSSQGLYDPLPQLPHIMLTELAYTAGVYLSSAQNSAQLTAPGDTRLKFFSEN